MLVQVRSDSDAQELRLWRGTSLMQANFCDEFHYKLYQRAHQAVHGIFGDNTYEEAEHALYDAVSCAIIIGKWGDRYLPTWEEIYAGTWNDAKKQSVRGE